MSTIDTSKPDTSKPSRLLDAWIGEKLMGMREGLYAEILDEERKGYVFVAVPKFSSDIAAAYEMEAEIERRGLKHEYSYQLSRIAMTDDDDDDQWALAHATPLQRCAAALAAMEGTP